MRHLFVRSLCHPTCTFAVHDLKWARYYYSCLTIVFKRHGYSLSVSKYLRHCWVKACLSYGINQPYKRKASFNTFDMVQIRFLIKNESINSTSQCLDKITQAVFFPFICDIFCLHESSCGHQILMTFCLESELNI